MWKHKNLHRPLEAIARTGFLTAIISYLAFWLVDVVKPGFVSRYLSVHIFLLAAILFGICWSRTMEEYTERPWLQSLTVVALGFLLAVLTWGVVEDLGIYRLFLVVLAFATPFVVCALIKS